MENTATNNNNNGGDNIFELPRAVSNVILYKVKIGMGELYDNMAKWERAELQRITRYASNVSIPDVDDFARYFRTLTWIRVTQATTPKLIKDYKTAVHSARVPNRLSTLLTNIGTAFDRESNIKFVPVCEIEAGDLMSISELMDFSDDIGTFLQDGYATVVGMEKSDLGSVMLMSKLVISDTDQVQKVLSYRKDNPVYAFFASILQMEIVDLTYQDLFRQYRVIYSNLDQYSNSFQQYYRSVASDPSQQSL